MAESTVWLVLVVLHIRYHLVHGSSTNRSSNSPLLPTGMVSTPTKAPKIVKRSFPVLMVRVRPVLAPVIISTIPVVRCVFGVQNLDYHEIEGFSSNMHYGGLEGSDRVTSKIRKVSMLVVQPI